VPTVVVGMRTETQVRGNLGWADEPLPAATWQALAALDPSRPSVLID
jgi:aryl-alcohol dehydrogenase-like predicted oxidoreductase